MSTEEEPNINVIYYSCIMLPGLYKMVIKYKLLDTDFFLNSNTPKG